MTYTPTLWQSGDELTAERMNHIEQGVAASQQTAVDVRAYGAEGNGTTDDTAAFTAATSAALAFGLTLIISAGRYVVANWNTRTSRVQWAPGAVLVQKSDTESVILSNSSETNIGTVAADIPLGASTITMSGYAAGSVVPGDILSLANAVSYDPNDSAALSGELVEVLSVAGQVITLKNRVKGSFATSKAYTVADGANVRKCNMVRGTQLIDPVIEGRTTATVPLVHIYYARDLRIIRPRITQGGDAGITLKMFWNVDIDHPVIENLTDNLTGNTATNQLGYAIQASNAGNGLQVTALIARNVRHGFTTTGGSRGVPSAITLTNPIVTGCNTAAGVDTHAAGNDITIIGGSVTSCAIGLAVRSKNTTVVGMNIRQCLTGVRIAETVAENIVLRSLTVEDCLVGVDISDPCTEITLESISVRTFSQFGFRIRAAVAGLRILAPTLINGQAGGIDFISTCSRMLISEGKFIDMCLGTAAVPVINSTTGSGGSGRIDIVSNKFIQNGSASKPDKAVNVIRGVIAQNTMLGSGNFSATNKWTVSGTQQTGNFEYA